MHDMNEARRAFEQEFKRLTGKAAHQLTERLIDLIKAEREALRKIDNGTRITPKPKP